MEFACVRVIFAAGLFSLIADSDNVRPVVFHHVEEYPLGLLSESLFSRSLRRPSVVIINWKCTSRSCFLMLLLLCGNVSVNPGPPVAAYQCGICICEVKDSDAAICCDCCDTWIHVSCDPKVTLTDYQFMLSNPSDDSWICSNCEYNISQLSPGSGIMTHSHLSCICFNARSILPKRFDLIAYLCANQLDVVAITESFLDSSIPDARIIPSGYTIFRRDHNRHGGGIVVLIRNSITAVRCKHLEGDCEMLWLELHTSRGVISLVIYYRPPTATVDSLQSLHSALAAACSSLPVAICGDFNVPDMDRITMSPKVKSPVTDCLCQLVCDNFCTQLVSCSTRGDNILDLLLTTHPDLVSSVEIVDSLPGCDHDAVQFNLSATMPKQTTVKRVLYNYKAANIDDLKEVLSRVCWDIIDYDSDDIELSWSQWKDLFFSAVNYVVPTVRWNRRKTMHWFSESTIKLILIHKKKQLYREYKRSGSSVTLKKYKSISNLVRLKCRQGTINHSNLVCQQSHSNPK